MKTPLQRWLSLAAVLGAGLLAGCSSPESRNEADPQVFSRMAPDQQALVKAGQAGIGFDADEVRLALGDPDRITTRTTAEGEAEVWHYTAYAANGVALYTGNYQSYRRHGFGWNGYWGPAYPYYLDYPDRVARDWFRVEFRDGRVAVIVRERT